MMQLFKCPDGIHIGICREMITRYLANKSLKLQFVDLKQYQLNVLEKRKEAR